MFDSICNSAPIFIVVFMLVAGFVCLIKGADFFVDGSASVAKKYKVPSIIIGLTIVAMGTSLPETAVSVTASLASNNELAVSNAVGSNIFNLMMVIGVSAFLTPIRVNNQTIKKDIPFSAICVLLLLALGILPDFIDPGMTLGRLDGILFIIIFAVFIFSLILAARRAQKNGEVVDETDNGDANRSILLCILFIVGGAAAIAIGGDLTVSSASRIAAELGMSQTLIGLTIVSIGTSLPELVTSVVAARRKEVDMALGNAVGSNIFNILLVLGVASAISPIAFIRENIVDMLVLLGFTVIVWIVARTRTTIDRLEGGVMVLLYAAYFAYIFFR